MTFYDQMQGVAKNLLTQFNQGGIVVSVSTPGGGPSYNPGPAVFVDVPVTGVVSGIDARYLTGTLIQATDLQVTIPGGIVAPKLADKVKLGGVPYQVIQIVPKPAIGTVAAYAIIVRK